MKLYKHDQSEGIRSYRQDYQIIGYIDDKKVDDFNDPIKVFIPIGMVDSRVSWNSNGNPIHIYDEIEPDDWSYLSTIDIEEVSKKEVKLVKQAIQERSDEINKWDVSLLNLLGKITRSYE